MIHLYTGDGKGKTTAAIGLCIRALGNGKRVAFAQFMKGNTSGELAVLEKLDGITLFHLKNRYGFYKDLSEEARRSLGEEQKAMLEALIVGVGRGDWDLVVLDEITHALNHGLLQEERVFELLKMTETEIVLTGRAASASLQERADYLTEMQCKAHPFSKGISARRGIEF